MKLSAARGRLKFSDNTTGAALMSGAALAFVLNDFLMKLVFAELSVVQGVFVRGMMVSPLLVAVCFYHKQLFVRLPALTAALCSGARRWKSRLLFVCWPCQNCRWHM